MTEANAHQILLAVRPLGRPINTRSLPDEALEQIFTKARTHSVWLPEPVSDELLHQIYDLMKWGAYQRQFISGTDRVCEIQRGEGKAAGLHGRRQCRENEDWRL